MVLMNRVVPTEYNANAFYGSFETQCLEAQGSNIFKYCAKTAKGRSPCMLAMPFLH